MSVALVVLGALVILSSVNLWLDGNQEGALPNKCNDGNPCTRDASKDGICEHKFWNQDRSCTQCYSSGNCDGSGHCVGAPADCIGVCDSTNADTCDNLWVFNAQWITDDGLPAGTVCSGDTCMGYAFFPVFVTDVDPIGFETAIQCQDLLDPDFYAANKTCITMQRFVADIATWATEQSQEWHECLYYWTCSVMDQTVLAGILSAGASATSGNGTAPFRRLPRVPTPSV